MRNFRHGFYLGFFTSGTSLNDFVFSQAKKTMRKSTRSSRIRRGDFDFTELSIIYSLHSCHFVETVQLPRRNKASTLPTKYHSRLPDRHSLLAPPKDRIPGARRHTARSFKVGRGLSIPGRTSGFDLEMGEERG